MTWVSHLKNFSEGSAVASGCTDLQDHVVVLDCVPLCRLEIEHYDCGEPSNKVHILRGAVHCKGLDLAVAVIRSEVRLRKRDGLNVASDVSHLISQGTSIADGS